MLKLILLASAAAASSPAMAQDNPASPVQGPVSSPSPAFGRYQIVMSPLLARDVFLLDTTTGSVWQLVKNPQDQDVWELMPKYNR